MLDNCFRFAPRDSIPGLIAKICKYLKDHPGWSEAELENQIKQFIGQNGVESFNGRNGAVVLNEDDVNNLKIASAYFAEGNETIDKLDLVSLYNQGVRFVFTDFNSVTHGYNTVFALEYFSGSGNVVYYPMSTGSSGGGNIVSVNGKTGVVELSLADIIGSSGVQVKLCTAEEFTSTTTETWNEYYNEGYRIVGVVNSSATAIDYIYILKQGENNHTPIGLSSSASDAYTPNNPPPYPVSSVNDKTGSVELKVVDVSKGNSTDKNAYIFIDEDDEYPEIVATDSAKLGGKVPEYYLPPRNLLDNSDFSNPVNQRGKSEYQFDSGYTIDRWKLHWTGDGNITIHDGYIAMSRETHSTYLFQSPENVEKMVGKTYTVAAKVRYNGCIGWIDSTQRVQTEYVNSNNWVIITRTFTVGSATSGIGYAAVEIRSNASRGFEVQWIALYEGSYTKDTLPPYVPKGYAAEMMECQRYYHLYATSSARPSNGLDCCPPMRIIGVTQGTITVDGETRYYNSADL